MTGTNVNSQDAFGKLGADENELLMQIISAALTTNKGRSRAKDMISYFQKSVTRYFICTAVPSKPKKTKSKCFLNKQKLNFKNSLKIVW